MNWINIRSPEDVQIFVFLAATTKPERVAADQGSAWAVMGDHAKVSTQLQNRFWRALLVRVYYLFLVYLSWLVLFLV